MSTSPSSLNKLLEQQLVVSQKLDEQASQQNTAGTPLEIPNSGKIVSSAYEQLRNAAEYAEENLLLQRAIKRFYRRNLFVTKRANHDLGTELIVDLLLAGYLQGGQFSTSTSALLTEQITYYMAVHGRLRQAHIGRETADAWVLALLSVEAENILHPHNVRHATLLLTYQHFLQTIPRKPYPDLPDMESYELCLYIAVHQAILKSDIDVIRSDIHRLFKQQVMDTGNFIDLSKRIDQLIASPSTQSLKRIVSRYGAPFRVLTGLVENHPGIPALLGDKTAFLETYDKQIDYEYQQTDRSLMRGLLKSIAFIFITKVLIGVAIEIPYDLLVHGSVIVLPLAINLLFPPLYLAVLVASLKPLGATNKESIHSYMERLLYGENKFALQTPRQRKSSVRARIGYSLILIVPLVITTLALQTVGFNVMQMIIFFVFFSTASFLGFRLRMLARELELRRQQTGLLGSLRDSFYLPFVASGQWLSRKYSKVNVIGTFMDVVIELPLKSVLRSLQQWMNFVREKHEELY